MNSWISIKYKMPDDFVWVLIAINVLDGKQCTMARWIPKGKFGMAPYSETGYWEFAFLEDGLDVQTVSTGYGKSGSGCGSGILGLEEDYASDEITHWMSIPEIKE
jgi:hypothetical protein